MELRSHFNGGEAESVNRRRSGACDAGRAQVEQVNQDVVSQAGGWRRHHNFRLIGSPINLERDHQEDESGRVSAWRAIGPIEPPLENGVIPAT